MKFPFHGAGAAKLGDDVSKYPPGTRLERVDPPRDPAVNVAEDMLKFLPFGGFRVRVRVESDGNSVETDIEVSPKSGATA